MTRTPTSVHDLPTPALVVDRTVLERNLRRMADKVERLGVALRPHFKTHKTVEIARRQMELGACGLTVATLEEARACAEHGFTDLTWAFPVILGRLREAREIDRAHGTRLRLVVDSDAAVEALEELGHPFHVLLKIDCGYHRAGVEPETATALQLAQRLGTSPKLRFDGLLTHSGQAYAARGRNALAEIAETERRVTTDFAARLRARGLEVPTVSVGSTPAMSAVRDLTGVTEARPGNYCYYDYTQSRIGSCRVEDCALTVLASVVSSGRSHCVVDAGALALSKDPGPSEDDPRTAARLLTEEGTLDPDRWLTGLSQEHGKVNAPLPVGTRMRILPHHSCLTNACFDHAWVVEGDRAVARWTIWRGR